MNQLVLCPDGQSPELSTPCPTEHVTPPLDLLPNTGLEGFAWLIFLAVTLIAVGVGIWLLSRDSA